MINKDRRTKSQFVYLLQLLKKNANLTIQTKIVGPNVEVKEESVMFADQLDIAVERNTLIAQQISLALYTKDIIRVLVANGKVCLS